MERAQWWRIEVGRKWDSLSGREREVLQLLTEGTDNNGIASSLNVSIHTVEKHLRNVFKKLGVTSRTEAILWWVEKGTDFRT
jgi:DNA-binding NarL/FixJ family response regulator